MDGVLERAQRENSGAVELRGMLSAILKCREEDGIGHYWGIIYIDPWREGEGSQWHDARI